MEEELTCRELVEIVTDYLEERLSCSDRQRFEEHLGCCPVCSIYLQQIREAIRLTGALRKEDVPAGARRDLLQAFRAWKLA